MGADEPTSNWTNPKASAEDRDRFAALVQYHYAHGRFDADELGRRLDAVLSADTLGELYRLCSDLPTPPALPDGPSRRRRG